MDADDIDEHSTIDDHIVWWMAHSFGKEPRPIQKEPIRKVFDMVPDDSDAYPSTYVIVAPTSGGKSLCRDTIGRMLRSIYWTICPLLSLSADQTEKMAEYQSQFGQGRMNYRIHNL